MECGESKDSHEFQMWKRIFGESKPNSPFGGGAPSRGTRGMGGFGNARRSSLSSSHVYDDGIDDSRLFHRRRTFREGAMVLAARLLMGASGEYCCM